jgi:hypothetical protein
MSRSPENLNAVAAALSARGMSYAQAEGMAETMDDPTFSLLLSEATRQEPWRDPHKYEFDPLDYGYLSRDWR